MNRPHYNHTPADLVEVIERLEQERPELGALDLDRVKVQAIRQAARSATAPRQKGLIMKSRFAVTTMLVLGIFMTGTGATLAKDAADHVYGKTDQKVTIQTNPTASSTPAQAPVAAPQSLAAPSEGAPVVAGEVESGEAPKAEPKGDVQGARQAAADSGEKLPFTGFAAIPVLMAGLGLIGGGLALRRGVERE